MREIFHRDPTAKNNRCRCCSKLKFFPPSRKNLTPPPFVERFSMLPNIKVAPNSKYMLPLHARAAHCISGSHSFLLRYYRIAFQCPVRSLNIRANRIILREVQVLLFIRVISISISFIYIL